MNQSSVRILDRDFTISLVLLNVVVTPESGSSTTYPAEILLADQTAQVSVNVTLPPGIPARIFPWTRPNP